MRTPNVLLLAALAVSAFLYYVSTGLGTVWPAAWLAPLPVLLVGFRGSAWRAGLCAGLAYFLGSLNLYSYLTQVLPVPVVVALLAFAAVVFGLGAAVARALHRGLPGWGAALVFPAFWTAYEFLLAQVSPHGTALSLAYSQSAFLPLIQIASVTGIWGVTFLVMWVPSAAAVAWAERSPRVLVVPAAVLALVLSYGVVRLERPVRGPSVAVGLAATDVGLSEAFATRDRSTALRVAQAYAGRARRLASQGAQVVILPEKFVGVTAADSDEVRKVFSDAARELRVTLVAGLNQVAPQRRNIALIFAPDGQTAAEYEKHHLLPGPETGYAMGATPAVFHPPGVLWGVAICKDMDFPGWSRQYGRKGVRIMAVPAWDFVVDGRMHSRMAVMRGVENGFALARAAQQGLLTFSDGYGRILAETSSGRGADSLLVRDIGPGPGSTLYTRLGDWFGWCTVAALAALIIASRTRFHTAERGSMTSKWSAPGNSTSRGGTESRERAAR